MADQGGNSSSTVMRDYRKGNWTVGETMILIEAKKMDDERRMKRSISSSGDHRHQSSESSSRMQSKPAELRWKWVEDYCWRKGCMRSQNQCNDKWDNLMRDYKKVRDYERRVVEEESNTNIELGSYWKIEKNERKERNLPTNMLPQIYEALVDVVEKKATHQSVVMAPHTGASTTSVMVPSCSATPILSYVHHHPPHPSLMMQHHNISAPSMAALPLPSPPVAAVPPVAAAPIQTQPFAFPYSQPALHTMPDSSDSDTSEHSNSSAAKRRRRRGSGGGEGTSGTASASPSSHEVGTAISKSASIIAEALQASEEKEERRHRDLLTLHEKRLKLEESKTEINRQGINGLVDAINKLANSIQALASHRNQSPASKSS
ncbi:hypothetical protein FNV43_RR06238 [Rhamnella rubrinervis]|uniref:Myb-like domain-containing protein n=1 Tax=Rhamnella rubrinervis TaxID=2594499 RepID=A0A8K0MLK9_9ROSA|nr:hypothetical protein FNV43_RR06238 [Rhamnella rubrinervis]